MKPKKCQYTDEAFKHIEVCRETDCKAPSCPKRELLVLTLDRSKAKTIQVALAMAKNHIKKGSDTMRELEGLEQELEAFTGSASVFIPG